MGFFGVFFTANLEMEAVQMQTVVSAWEHVLQNVFFIHPSCQGLLLSCKGGEDRQQARGQEGEHLCHLPAEIITEGTAVIY